MFCSLCDVPPDQVLFEDEHALVVLHEDWAVRGHVMVVSRRHVENVSDLSRDEWLRIAAVWHRAERILLEVTKADRVIVMKLGIETPHLHLHLYPVSAAASRAEIFAAITGETREARDEQFVNALARALRDTR